MKTGKERSVVRHAGIVSSVAGNEVSVTIEARSACAACHAKNYCSASDMQEKVICAAVPDGSAFRPGDRVEVSVGMNTGFKAVFFAYILPVVLMVGWIVGAVGAGLSEGIAGVGAILILLLYFFVLYLLRRRLDGKVKIEIEKL